MGDVIELRALGEADIEPALAIETATYPQPWTVGIFRDELAAKGRFYVAAVDGSGLAGYGGLMIVGDEAHVTSVTVAPDRRGRGVGTRIMHELARRAVAAGARSLTLEVRASNAAAQALYRRFGMAPVGVRKKYYLDEDALIMWVHDIDGPDYAARLDDIARGLGQEAAS